VQFEPTAIAGAFFVEFDVHEDERRLFARTFCEQVFAEAGIDMRIVQTNVCRNPTAGTLRGMHYQAPPHEEPKLVQWVRGRIFDVAINLRRDTPSHGHSVCAKMSADDNRLFFILAGCAYGFLTLEDNSDVFYCTGAAFVPVAARGVRWDDPAFEIPWPASPRLISARYAAYAGYALPSKVGV
jgi:dTDP-4-dehydrorhamnose 3,5-epimerase